MQGWIRSWLMYIIVRGQVIEFLNSLNVEGVSICISDETRELMDTGGALLLARDFLMEEADFLVHNVDVYTNLDIGELVRAHRGSGAIGNHGCKKALHLPFPVV